MRKANSVYQPDDPLLTDAILKCERNYLVAAWLGGIIVNRHQHRESLDPSDR